MLIEPVSVRRRVFQVAGDILEAKRRQLGLSYRDLEGRSAYDHTYISKICKAQRNAEPRVLSKIARALHFDEEYLESLVQLVLIPDNADKLSDAELGYDINRRFTFPRPILSSWEALVVTAILASGLPEVAERYLGFYTPNHSFTRHFVPLFKGLSESLKLSSLATLHQVIMNNRDEYSDDACAKKHFALYFGGMYGDFKLKQEVREACDSERSANTRRAGYIGLVLGLDIESASRYLRWFSEDEQAKQADVETHLEYYGGLQQAVKHLIDQLSTPGYAPLWPCSLNTVRVLTLHTEDSMQILGSLLHDKTTFAQINSNLSGAFTLDDELLKNAWQDFLIQIGSADRTLARLLAN